MGSDKQVKIMAENRLLSRIFGKEGNRAITKRTWMVFLSLILIFALALFLRSYFGFEEATRYGAPFLVSGGSDSYYHERAIYTAAYEHHSLIKDPMLNYPIGAKNPRPPGYDWSVVLGGYLLHPFVGDLATALSYSLIFSTAIWGALTIFPVYYIGKNIFNRKVGLIAAFIIATLPAHMQRSPLTDADHDAFVLFFVMSSIYFLLRALENIKEREWVERWRDVGQLRKGMKEMFSENRKTFLYAFLSASSILTVALTWKGFSYVYAILAFYFIIQLFVLTFRKTDPTTLTFVATIVLLIPILFSLPFYLNAGYSWLLAPLGMSAIVIGIGVYFSLSKRLPWTLTLPLLIAGIAIISILVILFAPSLIETIGRQTGYFTRTKVYKTIAEAQAPYFSNLVLSFGIATFFLALLGVGWILWKMRKNWSPHFVLFVLWSAESIYMALSAARFMFNAAPAFAIASAWVIYHIVKKADFASIKKTYRSLSGNKLYAIKKSVGIKHVIVALFLVFLVILPNVWYAVDAGIPSNDKKEYDSEVYTAMPDFLRPSSDVFNSSSRGTWYFGAFGYSLPTPDQYWPAAWSWLANQDSDELPKDRPAFLSWWDYGFECIQQGKHPTVADNFQYGYQIAGNFIMAQNETDAVSLLSERILDSEFNTKTEKFTDRAVNLMKEYLGDRDTEKIIDIYKNPQKYVPEILAHPEKYGPYDTQINDLNAKYIASRGVLMKYDLEHLVSFLHALEDMTGKRIGYFAIDSRLIPFSAQNTGIFYAPAVLSDHRISTGSYRLPYDFYQLYAVTKYGKKYPINDVPDDAKADIDHTEIEYKDMFYNTMLYRNYFGYSPEDVGSDVNGLPSLSDNLKNMMPMPGWNLTHFRLVYRTVYWNPYTDYRNHSDAWRAIGIDEGMKYQKEGKGVVDMSPNTAYNGVTFLEYYEGAIINGTVKTPEGRPVGGIRLTIYDEYGIPHQSVMTDNNGRYSLIAPFGNVTIVASTGGSLDKTRLLEKTVLNSTHLEIRKDQALRENIDLDGDGRWDYLVKKDLVASTSSVKGTVFLDTNNDGTKQDVEKGISANITLYGKSIKVNYTAVANESGGYEITDVVPGDYGIRVSVGAYTKDVNVTFTVEKEKEKQEDVAIPAGRITGKAVLDGGEPFAEKTIDIVNIQDGSEKSFVTDDNGEFFVDGVIPGVYSFIPENASYVASSFRIGVSENQSSKANITIYPAHRLEGYVNLNFKGVPFAALNFVNYTFPSMSRTVTCDKDGHYSVLLPEGEYTVTSTYIENGRTYMVLRYLKNYHDSTISFDMKETQEVSGYIRFHSEKSGAYYYKDLFPISFVREGGSRIVYYSSYGNYTARLPPGRYQVYVDYSFALFPYAYADKIEVGKEPVELNIDLVRGVTLRGYVRGVADTPLKAASITFTSEKGSFRTISDEKGYYTFNLVPGNYTMKVCHKWYMLKTMDIVASDEENPKDLDIQISPEEVTVYGQVKSTEGMAAGINVSFIGYNSTFNVTSDAGGNYSIDLPAGRYVLYVRQNIDENGTEVYQLKNRESIEINPEESPFKKDILIEKRYRISGEVLLDGRPANTTLWISSGYVSIPYESVNGTLDVYLPEGVYTLNSTAENSSYVVFQKLAVNGPENNITINFSKAYHVSITLMSEGKTKTGIPVKISSSEGAEKTFNPEGDVISAYLPSGKYSLSVNYTTEENTEGIVRNVTYSAEDTITVSGNTSHILDISRYVPEGRISALLVADGIPVNGTEIWLKSTDSGEEYNSTTNSQGEFSMELPMGSYVIYAHTSLGDNPYVVMEKVPIRENSTATLEMSQAVVFSGKALSDDGNGIRANITLINAEDQSIQKAFETDEQGNFDIKVPEGMYSIVANAKRMEYGVESNFIYQGDLSLNFSMQKNIILEKMKVHRPELSWDSSEKETASPGDTVVYHINVRNSGNCRDTYELSGSPWDFEFEPSSLTLNPGEEKQVVVTISLPADARVNHEPLKVRADVAGGGGSGDVTLDVNVLPVHGISAENISESSWVDGNAVYEFPIINTGNIEDSFSVIVENEGALNAQGWRTEIASQKAGPYSDFLGDLKIGANSTQTVYVKLIPIAARPSYSPELRLFIHSQNISSELSFTLPLPSIEIKSDVSLGGGAQIWVEKPLDMSPVYWALGIIIAVAAGYWVLKKKGVIM